MDRCAWEGCTRRATKRGYCHTCYTRARRAGTLPCRRPVRNGKDGTVMTRAEVARALGISEGLVYLIERSAARKIRAALGGGWRDLLPEPATDHRGWIGENVA